MQKVELMEWIGGVEWRKEHQVESQAESQPVQIQKSYDVFGSSYNWSIWLRAYQSGGIILFTDMSPAQKRGLGHGIQQTNS